MADLVEIILALKNVREFVAGADQASKSMGKMGDTSEKAGKQAGLGWKSVAKWAGGAAAIAGATKFVSGAVNATTDLAKSTLALQRQTNLDTQTASEWVGVLKERNIQTSTFQVGLKTLSKTMEKARIGGNTAASQIGELRRQIDDVSAAGGKKAPAEIAKLSTAIARAESQGTKSQSVFQKLGISLDAVRKGNTKEVLYEMADALSKIRNPAERSTYAQTLLGKSGITLLPILMKGRKAIEEQLGIQQKYGNYISGKGMKNAQKLIEQQREMHAAYSGLKVQLGQALLPVLVSVGKVLESIVNVAQPLLRNATLMKVVVGALVGAFIAYKAALVVATIQQLEFDAAANANVIGAIVLGVMALVAVTVLLVKHWGQVKAVFWDVFNWVKTNWPLLVAIILGPFGGPVFLLIFKNLDRIKQAAGDVASAIVKAWGTVGGAIKDAIDWLIRGWNSLRFKMPSINTHIPGVGKIGGWTVGVTPIPELATGGSIARSGVALVGERGPELVSFPTGAIVHPSSVTADAAAIAARSSGPLEIIVPVYLDKREIARSVATVTADRLARR